MLPHTMAGTIRRRVLLNATTSPDRIAPLLPAPFRPQLVRGRAVVGVCLIRLERLRPTGAPLAMGLSSENMAHRIAVEWDEGGATRFGVYIPERHSASRFATLAGGRVFPGRHEHANFTVVDGPSRFSLLAESHRTTLVELTASVADRVPADSVFGSVAAAKQFFAGGCVGFSPGYTPDLDGVELRTGAWSLEPLAVVRAHSSTIARWLGTEQVHWDSAFVMRDLDCEWHVAVAPAHEARTPTGAR